jgi:hypothetical protein
MNNKRKMEKKKLDGYIYKRASIQKTESWDTSIFRVQREYSEGKIAKRLSRSQCCKRDK